MIVRVCQAVASSGFDSLCVATDDERIESAVNLAGFQAVMTSSEHVSGTDRLQEAATIMALDAEDIVVNLQGDEPLMPVKNLVQVRDLLKTNVSAAVATLYVQESLADMNNANAVKLVTDRFGQVLYFSRAGIPFDRDQTRTSEDSFKRHVGIYAYRKSALDQFVQYAEGTLEKLEKLEQLRFMENGQSIVAQEAHEIIPAGVDTQEDLERVRQWFEQRSS
ncbi:3-deoxy-manno-octulosonate cytidylyltransferase [Reinekea blandensis MED297]|uniref:3-deoxy-manno-octulosonate cytidylyltransferase n=2 Tax=Reinekea TaxID=230494 RepID=A4BE06_9GAMM|nr:3-deoxy-manno-octulosonate cytidylyltransferase [Reinekea blandensis MED297]